MTFDNDSLTEEGWVLKDPTGNFIAFSERVTHTGSHCEVRPVRLSQATIFPSPDGPHLRTARGRAVVAYQSFIPDGTLEAIHVVRSVNTTVSEAPLPPGGGAIRT
jgi:hypothetical protein